MPDFLVRALLAGLALAVIAGPVGVLMLWRRMTFFGAALAHSAVLGVALGLLLGFSPWPATIALCLALALLLDLLTRDKSLSDDTLIGIVGHGSLAGAMIVIAYLDTVRVDLIGYLFGDILAVSDAETVMTALAATGLLALILLLWRPLVAVTAEPAIAQAEGAPARAASLAYSLILAAVVALGMRLVGALLIVSLLVMPAAAARRFASSPARMAVIGSAIAALSVIAGILISASSDWPAGPAIAVVAMGFFFLSRLAPR